MKQFEHQGMSLWYGAADTPAPAAEVRPDADISLIIGVRPAEPGNNVEVIYRVNRGPEQQLRAVWHRNAAAGKAQYYRAVFPALRAGDMVEYAAVCRCAGRQVPSPEQAKLLEGSFRVVAAIPESIQSQPSPLASPVPAEPDRPQPAPTQPVARSVPQVPTVSRARQPVAVDRAAASGEGRQAGSQAIPRPAPTLPNTSLSELSRTLRLEHGSELLQALERHGIRTLEEVRKAGGIGRLADLPVAADHLAVRALEAQANLSILSSDIQINTKLAEAGYASVADIARRPVGAFVEATRSALDVREAVRLHHDARAKKAFLDNIITMRRLDAANGYHSDGRRADGAAISLPGDSGVIAAPLRDMAGNQPMPEEESCACRDCDAAVSPRAYLADLLAYAVNWRLRRPRPGGGTEYLLRLEDLVAILHQPFDDLPASCAAVDEQVRQVRICAEVLRHYLGSRPLSDAGKEEALNRAERGYRLQAYTTVLLQIGTSYEELRRARGASAQDRKALAERLGIDLTEPRPLDGDELDQLLLDPSVQAPDPHALTEHALERLFGLADTMRDPLSQGAKLGDEQSQIARWKLAGVAWGKNTDRQGMIYGKVDYVTEQVPWSIARVSKVQVGLYKENSRVREDLVALGTEPSATQPVSVTPIGSSSVIAPPVQQADAGLTLALISKNRSDLSGVIKLASSSPQIGEFTIVAIPSLLSWRLSFLHRLWQENDWPADLPSPPLTLGNVGYWNENPFMSDWSGIPLLPIGYRPDGLMVHRSGNAYFSSQHAAEVSTTTSGTAGYLAQEVHIPEALRGGRVNAAVAAKTSGPRPEFDGALEFDGHDDYMTVADSPTLALEDSATFEVWLSPHAIGTSAAGVILSKENSFGIARFPDGTIRWAFENTGPGWVWINTGYVAGSHRWTHIALVYDARNGEARTYTDGVLRHTERIAGNIGASDAPLYIGGYPGATQCFAGLIGEIRIWKTVRGEAEINRDLHLRLGGGEMRLVAYWRFDQHIEDSVPDQTRNGNHGVLGGEVEASRPQWRELAATMRIELWQGPANADKVKLLERSFTLSEEWRRFGAQGTLSQDAEALQVRAYVINPAILGGFFVELGAGVHDTPPLIDPDVITSEHCSSDDARRLWAERRQWIDCQLNGGAGCLPDAIGLRTIGGTPRERFERMVQQVLHVLPQTLLALAAHQEGGHDIETAIAELGLSQAAFSFLARMQELAAITNLLESEWEEVYNIFVQVLKRRKFSEWRDQEKQNRVYLCPIHFQMPKPSLPLSFPPRQPDPPPTWRGTLRDRRDWEDRLQSRVDQEQATIDSLRQAVSAAEEATLPLLRRALIDASDAQGNSPEARAKWLSDRLLIDMQIAGCQATTRISQAIQTLLELLWSLRTGQLQDTNTYSEWTLEDPEHTFDEEWKWLGSYATWRAALFVYLYPENILHPTLRKWQSSGFEELVQSLRQGRRLNPEVARQIAEEYAKYYQDVTHLEIPVSCQAGNWTYWYGHAPSPIGSGACYWSRFTHNKGEPLYDAEYPQTSWYKIQGLSGKNKTMQILGAVPFGGTNEQPMSILVFAKQKKGNQYVLVVARHNLGDGSWESDEPAELELPDGVTDFWAHVNQIRSVEVPPSVIITETAHGWIYDERYLNASGDNWEEIAGDWGTEFFSRYFTQQSAAVLYSGGREILQGPTDFRSGVYLKALLPHPNPRNANSRYFFFEKRIWNANGDIEHNYLGIGYHDGASPPDVERADRAWAQLIGNPNYVEGDWHRAFSWMSNDVVFAHYNPRSASPLGPAYALDSLRLAVLYVGQLEHIHAPQIDLPPVGRGRHVIDSGPIDSKLGLILAFGDTDMGAIRWQATIVSLAADDDIAIGQIWQITPSERTPRPLEPGPFGKSQEQWRAHSQALLEAHNDAPASTRAYIEEYYYFVPMLLALELQRRGYYQEALDWYRTIYDYTAADPSRRKIWHWLTLEEQPDLTTYARAKDWLRDPLDPHAIAAARPNTYTRYTLMSLVRCFLDYGDAEFTLDTAESVPRARALYTTALELLESEVLNQRLDNTCDELIAELLIRIGKDEKISEGLKPGLIEVVRELETIGNLAKLEQAAGRINELVDGVGPTIPPVPPEEILTQVRGIVEDVKASLPAPLNFETALNRNAARTDRAHTSLLAEPAIAEAVSRIGMEARGEIGLLEPATGNGPDLGTASGGNLGRRGSFEAQPRAGMPGIRAELVANPEGRTAFPERTPRQGTGDRGLLFSRGMGAIPEESEIIPGYIPAPSFEFCIPPNPFLSTLRTHAELNLHKIRNCRNIAGMQRELDPYAAATDTVSGLPTIGAGGQLILPGLVRLQPTPYRYAALIERAKQLAQQAAQFEAAMLSALEKRDNEYYNLLKARQEVRLTRAGVRLQNLRVREAEHSVVLAELQRRRAEIQVEHYTKLIDEGISDLEGWAIGFMISSAAFQVTASLLYFGAVSGNPFDPKNLQLEAQGFSSLAGATSTTASIFSTYASYERRAEEWQFQKSLADQDVLIGGQQVTLAQDHERIVGQELKIAEIQADNAEATAAFLANKDLNAQLYDWMSGILEGVYSFFLHQATAMARLAEHQLAFERQEVPPAFIQADYWEAPSDLAIGDSTDGKTPERHGLTGSARLIQDIYQLDQHAFEKDKRKLQLTKTISLAHLSPIEFQQFRETGVLVFATPMELFDRNFPGHYLRLIKRVRTSVIALIPPTEGMHATLSTLGTSRVVIGPEVFQTVIVRRGPESVALTSPRDATGLFELQQQPEMLLPFEGIGVDTSWEFRMPKASNAFDYSTIADVLFTIEYTALDNYDYRQQVIQELDTRISADRVFSFRNQFADQWWDLHNPEQSTTPMTVRFKTGQADFPPNIEGLKIERVMLFFAQASSVSFDITQNLSAQVTHLRFTGQGASPRMPGGTTAVEYAVSVVQGNASTWISGGAGSPIGEWELVLPNTDTVKRQFKNNQVDDILFVITCTGRVPEWPV